MFHQNIRGLFSKKGLVEEFLHRSSNIGIFTLSETHIETTEDDNLYNISGYSFENKPRKSGKGGGVAVYISDNIQYRRREDLEEHDVEWIWLEITPRSSKCFLVCCIYRPPVSSKHLPQNFETKLSNTLSKLSTLSRECIILCDVNVNFLSKNNKDFKQTFLLYGFKQLINKATRFTDTNASLIDIIAPNNSQNISKTEVISLSFSDHEMVGCTRKLNHQKFEHETISSRDYKN